ncbi:ATP-binding protein [Polynucleobacter sp.]|uniref:sensor histidine kinase n=1 Tax=Polynucleobacter sp. TaxID=2029855 RepID=UPI0027349C18|nr:ATP-binding protein [Polynucleobacter sp.]MDP3121560.1 ATP-binding protein [Polynucleobacter sp.]
MSLLRFDRPAWKRRALPIATAATGIFALALLVLLSTATSNTSFFDNYFIWLYAANVVVGICLLLVIVTLVVVITIRWKKGRFGTRLIAKLAMIFGLVGVVPGLILYGVSLQFVSRSIDTWFDVKVESALEAGLELGRATLSTSLQELQDEGRIVADQLQRIPNQASPAELTLLLSRMRDQFGIQEITIFNARQAVVATASSGVTSSVAVAPSAEIMSQANKVNGVGFIEELQGTQDYRLKAVIPLVKEKSSGQGFGLSLQYQRELWYLQLIKRVPDEITKNTLAVQAAYSDYQEKSLGRTGLRQMYIGTLTLTLFFALFVAVTLALLLGRQLARPLLMLLRGTQAVAQGDLSPKPELDTGDELGMLTRQFNVMTRQLADTRTSLQESKSFLETVLSNLTAGVCIFDDAFKLVSSNAGADAIFRHDLTQLTGKALSQIPALAEFETAVKEGFAAMQMTVGPRVGDDLPATKGLDQTSARVWQKQIQLHASSEFDQELGVTIFVRGTELAPGLNMIVFDDITDVVTAQRSIAWSEVARRLAHEIKNPLTPIQLSAERLQQKLAGKVSPEQEDMMNRSTATIIGQVEAMKQMVNDFRDFAKTPAPQLRAVSINQLIQEILVLYEGSPMEVSLDSACPDILGDPTQLRQVIHNLLQNAQDSTLEGQRTGASVAITTEAVPYKQANGVMQKAVRFSITDSGAGFPAKILARAFEPYVTTKTKGTGLGLAVVKKIVDDHGAKIEIRNRMQGDVVVGAQVSILFMNLAKEAV